MHLFTGASLIPAQISHRARLLHQRSAASGHRLNLQEDKEGNKRMLKAVHILLAIAAAGVVVWQFGGAVGIPGAPVKPDTSITVSALAAAIIFFGLWCVGMVNKRKVRSEVASE